MQTATTMFIDGAWTRAHGAHTSFVVDPATEETVAQVAVGDTVDVDRAVAAARRALPAWAGTPVSRRVQHLHDLAAVLEARAGDFTHLITTENGTPVRETAGAAPHAAAFLRHTAGLAGSLADTQVRENPLDEAHTVIRAAPVGVVGIVTPWNFPLSLIIIKLAPALLAGCTVVVKPAPETPLAARLLAEAVEQAGLPAGVVNLVTGGTVAGEALVAHRGVAKVSFTGSTAVGRRIGAVCAQRLVPVSLELGGKSAAVVLDDVDPDVLAANLVKTTLRNTGQTCKASTRLLLPRTRAAELLDLVCDVLTAAPLGDPRDPQTVFGPVVSSGQRERVEGHIARARAEGATVALGGGRPPSQDRGWFVEPTVFAEVTPDMAIAREEVFGPVLAVLVHDGDDEAVRLANDSDYGLAGAVFGADPDRAFGVAARIETGNIGINHYGSNLAAPFSGHKDSGLGVDFGPEGLAQYQKLTSVHVRGRAS